MSRVSNHHPEALETQDPRRRAAFSQRVEADGTAGPVRRKVGWDAWGPTALTWDAAVRVCRGPTGRAVVRTYPAPDGAVVRFVDEG